MYEINENVVYVKGASQGAIYNFNSGHIYSINGQACKIIDKLLNNDSLTKDEKNYIDVLIGNKLYSNNFKIVKYHPHKYYFDNLKLAWLEITQACNMRCVHCYEGNTHIQSKNILSLEKWKEIIDELKELNVNRVVVIGGEPTLNNNIKDILKYLSVKKIPTTLFTNASFVDDELRNVIVENDIRLKISLYGYNAFTHDSITGREGSFDILVNNIKYFLKKSVDISVAVTLMKENEHCVKEIEEFINSLGIKRYKFDVIREVYCGTQHNHIPTMDKIKDYSLRTQPNFKTDKEFFDKYFDKNTCWYGKLVVTEEGNVLPCVFERNIIFGNVTTNTIAEIISNEKTSYYWGLDYSKIDICKDCEYRFACTDCRPLAFSKAGNIFEKNIRCTYNPYKGEWQNVEKM